MKFAVLDFETTGDQNTDEIIQAGLVIIENHQIIEQYSSYVKPSRSIPAFITKLTGITDGMVEDAPPLSEVAKELRNRLGDCILVAHHAAFDLAFLQRAFEKCYLPPFTGKVLDTYDLVKILHPSIPSLQLSSICSVLGVSHERPHQADSDALATAHIWLHCLERLQELPLLTIQRFTHVVDPDGSDLGWFLVQIRLLREVQTAIDLDSGKYFRQFALEVMDWGEEQAPRDADSFQLSDIPAEFATFYTQFKEALQQRFNRYEQRTSQDEMIQEVFESFLGDRHLLVEAGTGTGKSLGYLIPALYYGIMNEKKVIVSTHTINLQEQLRQRDIPLLLDLFPIPFRASILKGRSHYLCLRKFEHKINTRDFEPTRDDQVMAAQMIVWLGTTKHGDDEELHLGPKGAPFWHTVASDSDSCLNRACPWFKKCFYHRARHEANLADVVITNHSLLFTDVKADNRLLPPYEHLVIDEAHHFEEVASKHLGIDVQYLEFVNTLVWMLKDSRSGQLPLLKTRLSRTDNEKAQRSAEQIEALYEKIVAIRDQWELLSEGLFQTAAQALDTGQNESVQYLLRLKSPEFPAGWEQCLVLEDNIYVLATEVLKTLEKIAEELKDVQEELDIQAALTDLAGSVKELYGHRDSLRFFMRQPDKGYVYWMEANGTYKHKSLQLICVPIDVSPMLRQYFFKAKDSIVLTSATLSVNKSFQYASDQLGLDYAEASGKVHAVQLTSPFRYREQALVCIPRDFPSLRNASGDHEFIETLVESLRDIAIATKGRMLVLFTSYRMLKQVYSPLKEQLYAHGIQVLGQGLDSGNRSKLTRLFQDTPAAVLMGTSSFWEGVDIPGDKLSCLSIVRLPFQPPNHPVAEAKSEKLKESGQNPFMKLSVPQAVIRFKQGFGRLVRTASDRGIVVIYDTRVIDSYYGKHFLYSLPGPKIEHMPTRRLVSRISEWLNHKELELEERQ